MIVNTNEFRREALYFERHGKYPYPFPRDISAAEYSLKRQAKAYWDDQLYRIHNGYTVGGVRVTGEHYGYMNFGQIKLLDVHNQESIAQMKEALRMKAKDIRNRKRNKSFAFPDFWDGDFEYFHFIEICETGIAGEDMDIMIDKYGFVNRPVRDDEDGDIYPGKHLFVAKARRKGYSYKNGYLCANRYHFVPSSVSIIGAYDSTYLTTADGTMQMAKNYIDFIDKNTAFTKRRLKDQLKEEIRSGFKQSGRDEGYKSSIIPITFRNNPSAARGKDATLVLLEELGVFPNAPAAIRSTADTLKDGIYVTGLMVGFGTSGGKKSDWEVFEEIFYTPKVYGALAFENYRETNSENSICSFFHPYTRNLKGFMDKEGNTLTKKAEKYYEDKLVELEKEGGKKAVIAFKQENPEKPSDAFSDIGVNDFPVEELIEHRSYLLNDGFYFKFPRYGKLKKDTEGKVYLDMKTDHEPVWRYPHNNGDDLHGCYVEYYPPMLDRRGRVQPIYAASQDPYAHNKPNEELTKRDSLGVTYIHEITNNLSKDKGDKIVATIIGRPENVDEYHKQVFLALERYNCKLQFENDRGNTIEYAKFHKKTIYLEEEPELPFAKDVAGKLGRGYGMHMTESRKNKGILYLNQWLRTVRGVDANGNEILNLHYILDIGTIDELIKFKKKGNFDRVSALLISMYNVREFEYNEEAKSSYTEERDDYFNDAY